MITVRNKVLSFEEISYDCVIGKNGVTTNKIEGDKCTPAGTYSIDKVYFRKDRITMPILKFDTTPIRKNFGWCDDVNSSKYNQLIEFPFSKSAENLFREDNIYDIICSTTYNTNPAIRNRGSAIFLHVAKNDFSSTLGCIALKKTDLIELLMKIDAKTKINVLS